jgi:hypothetical protein
MSDSAFIMIPMTYATSCETARSAWRNGPSAFAGFSRFVSGPKRNDAAAFDWRRRCERASDLELCPQKLRKGALKPLKQLVHVNLCAAWESSSTRGGKAEPAISSAFRPASRVAVSGRGRAVEPPPTTRSPPGYAEPPTARNRRANRRRPISSSIIICGSQARGEILVDNIKHESSRHRGRCDRRRRARPARAIRALKGPSALVFNGLTG